MNNLRPSSRLTIIFILALVLSGSILTWFSINNISNLKELTEKRILEEQRELFNRYTTEIRDNLGKVTEGYDMAISTPGLLKDSLLKSSKNHDFINQSFILDKNGMFIYPNFKGIPDNQLPVKHSQKFIAGLRGGEKAEFTERDFLKARDNYLICLKSSCNGNDSASALNLLGRISVKLNAFDDAVRYYYLILNNFSIKTDGNGIPYIDYALPRLLEITGKDSQHKILSPILSGLKKMQSGLIPLSYNTGELLDLITKWVNENTISINERTEIYNLIQSIRQQVQFIITCGNELTEHVVTGDPENYPDAGNGFIIINSVHGNRQEFFLLKTSLGNPTGFLIDRNKFLGDILRTDLLSGLEFDNKIELINQNNLNSSDQELVLTSQLTPWFPDQAVEIKLSNENLIKELVRRRSWIYGFASLLLIVAMVMGVVLILRDISRERNLTRLRSDFISTVTHELKTPLTSIRMFTESLLMGRVKTPESQKEYLEVVVNESERLKRMINNILEFSKMEKGKPEYHYLNSNLAAILKSSIREMSYWLEKENFEVITQLDENINADVDPEKMKQVIENLLSNSIRYSNEIKRIFIRLFREKDDIHIEVEDNGIGIPEDQLSRIFEPFYRIEQKENITGTGLGLTVVREIVETHGGKISVSSEIGKGSVFAVRIPLVIT